MKTIKIIFVLFITINKLLAQDTQFSQFYSVPLYLSPSFTGNIENSRIILNYRNQWPELKGSFITYSFSFDHYFDKYNSGIGIMTMYDKSGSGNLYLTNINLLYSYNFNINHKWVIRPGLNFNINQRTVDWDKQIFGDQLSFNGISPSTLTPIPIDEVNYFDASTSIVSYTEKIWFGITLDHLMTPNQSFTFSESRIPIKYSFFGGVKYPLNNSFGKIKEESISFSFLYKNQLKFNQFDIGVYWSKLPLNIGLMYRGIPFLNKKIYGYLNNDAIIIFVGLKNDNYSIGYSYDFTISTLMLSLGGSHELSFSYLINNVKKSKKHTKIPCPDF